MPSYSVGTRCSSPLNACEIAYKPLSATSFIDIATFGNAIFGFELLIFDEVLATSLISKIFSPFVFASSNIFSDDSRMYSLLGSSTL